MTEHTELELLLESFKRNGRVNKAALNTITKTDLAISDERGGWSIGHHLGHLAEFRYSWLSLISPTHAEDIPSVVDGDEQSFHLTTESLRELEQAFSVGDAAALKAVVSALDEDRSFEGAYQSHPAHFLQHILVHDAHHRGQVLSLLRKGGRTPEQMDALDEATWPIWRE